MYLLLRDYGDNVLVSDYMTQSHSLRYMSCTCAPDQCILECLLQRSVDLITHLLDGGLITDDKGLAEVRIFSFSVYSQNPGGWSSE